MSAILRQFCFYADLYCANDIQELLAMKMGGRQLRKKMVLSIRSRHLKQSCMIEGESSFG